MAAVADQQNPHAARFKEFLARGVMVARQRIEAEGEDAPISDGARERAQNVLRYALAEDEAWAATRKLLLTMAPKMEMAGYREEWLQSLQDGLAYSQHRGDQPTTAALQFHCGYLYRLMSNYTQAQPLLEASNAFYAAAAEPQNQARALNQLAYLAWQQQRYDEATALLQKVLAIVADSSLEKAVSLSVAGLIATDQNNAQVAEAYHREALAIRTYHGVKREMAWSLQNIGVALRQQDNYEQAIGHYEAAIALLDQVHDLAYKAVVQMNLGSVYYAQGKVDAALKIITTAEQTLRKVADEFNLAKLLTTKGLCYLALNEWQSAESAFATSAQLFKQLDNYSWYLNALDGLGISYLERERYDDALAIFESIAAQLPQIEGTLAHQYLATTIAAQLEQAMSKQVRRGHSVYMPPRARS